MLSLLPVCLPPCLAVSGFVSVCVASLCAFRLFLHFVLHSFVFLLVYFRQSFSLLYYDVCCLSLVLHDYLLLPVLPRLALPLIHAVFTGNFSALDSR